ncbi:LysR family transcriptional regulator [Streptomyces sp. MMS24-I2-30]|uniref:LysR family transcriptional regulator n=1 Tax=Streptomyces sp. MMS24-I2-30 TaxID=3351564 RepID=UPI003896A68A
MDWLETRELHYFVTVAKELHFAKAAERLGISQPPLSRAIARLERRVGTALLHRTSRRVELTPAGESFLADAQTILEAIAAAPRRARQAARGDRLIVAARPGTSAGLLADVLQVYERQDDALPVHIVFTDNQAGALRDGTADVGLLCGTDDLSEVRTEELIPERSVALVPSGHRYAAYPEVSVGELRQDPAYQPSPPSTALHEIVDLVALGKLVVVVGESIRHRLGPDVVAVPLADDPGTMLVLAWHPRSLAALRDPFVRAARTVAEERFTANPAG